MTQNLSKPEPAPQPNGNTHLWSLVIRDMLDRNSAGVEKYGTALQAGNGRDALMDAYQEALDLCVYLRQAIEKRRAMLHVARHGVVVDDTFEPWQSAIPEQDVQRREQVATGASAMDRVLASASRVEVHNGPNGDSRVPMPEVYGRYVVCSGCGLKCSIGSEQEQSVNLTGRCTICRDEKERETYTVPPLQDGDDDPAVVHVVPDRTSRAAIKPLPKIDERCKRPDVVRAAYEGVRTLPDECLGALCGRVGR